MKLTVFDTFVAEGTVQDLALFTVYVADMLRRLQEKMEKDQMKDELQSLFRAIQTIKDKQEGADAQDD